MGQKCDRFKTGVVFRVCIGCRKMVGCWFDGQVHDCKTCGTNCPFRNAKISVEGFQLLEGIDSNTSTMCDECVLASMRELQKEYPEIEIAI